jgi:hypothetical protein
MSTDNKGQIVYNYLKKFTFFEKKFLKNLEIRKKIYIFAMLKQTIELWRKF